MLARATTLALLLLVAGPASGNISEAAAQQDPGSAQEEEVLAIEPYAMIGIGILDIDQDLRHGEDDFAFRGAAGVDFYLTPRWALYGEASYLLGTGDVSDFDYATFGGGLLFRF